MFPASAAAPVVPSLPCPSLKSLLVYVDGSCIIVCIVKMEMKFLKKHTNYSPVTWGVETSATVGHPGVGA